MSEQSPEKTEKKHRSSRKKESSSSSSNPEGSTNNHAHEDSPKSSEQKKSSSKESKKKEEHQHQEKQEKEQSQDQLSLDASLNASANNAAGGELSPGEERSPSGRVKHGRRSVREGEYSDVPLARKGWGEESEQKPLYASASGATTTTQQHQKFEEIDAATAAAQHQHDVAALAAHEQLVQEVANAPTEYHSAMPKQSDLERDTAAKFQVLLQQAAADGIDLQCLMSTLTGQFDDDDSAWEPDHLLLQLTSEINDRFASGDEEDGVAMTVDEAAAAAAASVAAGSDEGQHSDSFNEKQQHHHQQAGEAMTFRRSDYEGGEMDSLSSPTLSKSDNEQQSNATHGRRRRG